MAKANGERKLRHLGFVHAAAIRILAVVWSAYELGKERSGPLKGGVERAEGTVKGLVAPLRQKVLDASFHLLHFVDVKVDHLALKLERHVPCPVWDGCAIVQKAPGAIRELTRSIRRHGMTEVAAALAKDAVASYKPKAWELYGKYEPAAERCAVATWRRLHALPLFPHVAQIAVPTAAYWAEKYNGIVVYGRENGYAVAGYAPVVPVERIAKVFGNGGAAAVDSRGAVAAQ